MSRDTYSDWNDQDFIEALREIDESEEANVSSWECDFIENLVYKMGRGFSGRLSVSQRQKAIEIFQKNEDILGIE